MKILKTTFVTLMVAALLLVSAGAVGAAKLDEPIQTFSVADPGTGGGGGR